MKVIETIDQMRGAVLAARRAGKTSGLVPTMGALHEGHFSLIEAAAAECDFVVVTIFVNPTQFGPNEDLDTYPRTGEADIDACRSHGVHVVFMPDVETMYPPGSGTRVGVPGLSDTLCGAGRPAHFDGVCTVVTKLLNIVPADRVYFGQKDLQQTVIVERMVADLNVPVVVVVCPTVRQADGLAVSSRNAYLTPSQRRQAAALHGSLELAAEMIRRDRPPAAQVIDAMRNHLAENAPDGRVDYVRIVNPRTLRDVEDTDETMAVALAVRFDRARLIDNMIVDAADGRA